MKVHFLNCGTMCPFAGRLVNVEGRLVCRCLLVESPRGLVLVDTGIGPRNLGRAFNAVAGPSYDPAELPSSRVRALGFEPRDVRHVVVTHLDLDHAGGLVEFPEARVHLHEREYQGAVAHPSLRERFRYISSQWAHGPKWERYVEAGDRWHGLEAVRGLRGLDDEILLVPLFGHSRGHSGVAVRGDEGWILHCGDAYFQQTQMNARATCSFGLTVFQEAVQFDRKARMRNLERLRALPAPVRRVCSHDP